jgi:hypothetical protein
MLCVEVNASQVSTNVKVTGNFVILNTIMVFPVSVNSGFILFKNGYILN